jgi:hypothetical protein
MRLTLTIHVPELAGRPLGVIRLRRALKGLWRGYGDRVVAIEPAQVKNWPDQIASIAPDKRRVAGTAQASSEGATRQTQIQGASTHGLASNRRSEYR